ncbi:MAG: VOC family protein [Proteobacteria bacterium]|nr:VOC family protein [Pseudomonadota bacterium]
MDAKTGTEPRRAKVVGINHVALEVGDIDEALAFYGRIFEFTLRSRSESMAFIDLGDQFINLTRASGHDGVEARHFGLVVDDRSGVRALAEQAGARLLDGPFLDFLDPWGNRIEVVDYANVQFSKTPAVLRGMGLELGKNDKALRELAAKGMA